MIFDSTTTFSGATAFDGTKTAQGPITVTQVSTNVIDLRPIPGSPSIIDEGIDGTDLYLYVKAVQAFNNLTSLTVTLESSAAPTMTTPTVHLTKTIPLAGLTANQDIVRIQIPSEDYLRYLGVRYTVNGAAPSTGTVLAALVMSFQRNTIFPGSFVVG